MSKFTQNKSATNAEFIKHRHDWQIRNYRFCKYGKDELTSPPFTVPSYGKEQWHIELINCWRMAPVNAYEESLRLVLNAEPKNLLLDLTLSIITSEESVADSYRSLEFLVEKNGHWCLSVYDGLGKVIKNLPSDTFTIRCEIILLTKIENIPLLKDPVKFQMPERDFSDDLEQLYNDDTTADVTLTVQNTTIHAHKAILMARSPVFAAMFRNNMKESITKNVDIENLDAEILEATLRFIYTDRVADLEDKAIQLLDAAEKYDLQNLRVMCEVSLSKHICVENAAEILVIADRHRAHHLKTQLHHFIKSHIAEVFNTEGYKKLEHYHPQLTLEAFKVIAVL